MSILEGLAAADPFLCEVNDTAKGQKGQRGKGAKGAKGQRDKGTKGQRDKGTK